MFMLVPCVGLWLLCAPRLRHWLRRREPYEACALGLLIFSPVLVWNARHGWFSLQHVATQAGAAGDGRPLLAMLAGGPEFLGAQIGVVSPILFGLMVAAARWAWREGLRHDREEMLLLVCASVPVFLFFQVWSFVTKVQANWAAHAYVTAAVAVAGWVQARTGAGSPGPARRRLRRLLLAGILLPALVVPLGFYPDALGWVGVRPPAFLDLVSKRLRGWPELGRIVGEAAAAAPRPPFLASDRYQIASQLAFYVPGQPRVYNANFGRRMNQYDLWDGWEALLGRDGLVVMYGTPEAPAPLREAFRAVEPLRTVVITHRGRRLQEFTLFYGHEFRGFPARPFAGF
jgi:undecaprenyl-diphosphatase